MITLSDELKNPCALKGRLANPDDSDVGEIAVQWINARGDWACERSRADGLVNVILRHNGAVIAAIKGKQR